MQAKRFSSIEPLELLSLQENNLPEAHPPLCRFHNRYSSNFTIMDVLELSVISEGSETDRVSLDSSRKGEGVMDRVKTMKCLKISAVKDMTEEECYLRYTKDPFFKKKAEFELQQLTKHKRKLTFNFQQQKKDQAFAIDDWDDRTTFKKVKQREAIHKLEQKKKYDSITFKVAMSRITAKNKENIS